MNGVPVARQSRDPARPQAALRAANIRFAQSFGRGYPIPDYDIENYLPGDPSSQNYVSEICIPVRKSKDSIS